ncbi:hypothetical protein EV356DRAFT_174415 [Viridothelium virens]|uniref:Blue (type 1) copper domain-containing protein n=1 Tax=Viridothelium virens TaxID=1048519 RepID=A0A6A6H8N3_VIRVR|nr:hypothetical protein EV356DRAFT_174415 [Viridothelium virens]
MHFSTITNVLALGLLASTPMVVAEDTLAEKGSLIKRYIGGPANAAMSLIQAKREATALISREPAPEPELVSALEPRRHRSSNNNGGSTSNNNGGSTSSSNNNNNGTSTNGNANGNANGNSNGNANGNANGNTNGNTNGNANGNANGVAATINVGQNGLTFTPSSVNVPAGSKVQFNFYPQNHSVVQGNVNTACAPTANGFFSGLIASNQGNQGQQSFTVTVPNTQPMYFYCSAPGHCQAGMAGAINPPSSGSGSVSQFIANSQKTQQTINPNAQPGQGGQLNAQNVSPGTPGPVNPSGSSSSSNNNGQQSGQSTNGQQNGQSTNGQQNGQSSGSRHRNSQNNRRDYAEYYQSL